MNEQIKWERSSYDTTIMQCSCVDIPLDSWYRLMVSLVQGMESTGEFDIHANGYRTHPGIFVTEGVSGSFKGHGFNIWSDRQGEIILKHLKGSRSTIEPLCNKVKECWLNLNEDLPCSKQQ